MVSCLSNYGVDLSIAFNHLEHGCYSLHCTMQEEITPQLYTSSHGHCRLSILYICVYIGNENKSDTVYIATKRFRILSINRNTYTML